MRPGGLTGTVRVLLCRSDPGGGLLGFPPLAGFPAINSPPIIVESAACRRVDLTAEAQSAPGGLIEIHDDFEEPLDELREYTG